ncbi:MAG: hypothetical protein LBB64_03935 [Dysgonamonadaceae bacterium]|jgi:hypothetical protein|nr:hypothetical protein [Dysgonamonadaceae bacterium]
MKKLILLCSLVTILLSCDVAKQVANSALAFSQCQYEYTSISGLTLAGVNLQNVNSISSLNPLAAAGLLTAVTQKTLPLQFTLNLNVKNPNTHTASLSGLQYILEIDDIQMTQGSLNRSIQVPGNGTAILPINMAFDLRSILSGKSADAVKNLAFNFTGLGDAPSKVTIRLKPSMSIGGQTIASPVFIPVSFTYGKGYK